MTFAREHAVTLAEWLGEGVHDAEAARRG